MTRKVEVCIAKNSRLCLCVCLCVSILFFGDTTNRSLFVFLGTCSPGTRLSAAGGGERAKCACIGAEKLDCVTSRCVFNVGTTALGEVGGKGRHACDTWRCFPFLHCTRVCMT